jgi:hypothetical protein
LKSSIRLEFGEFLESGTEGAHRLTQLIARLTIYVEGVGDEFDVLFEFAGFVKSQLELLQMRGGEKRGVSGFRHNENFFNTPNGRSDRSAKLNAMTHCEKLITLTQNTGGTAF